MFAMNNWKAPNGVPAPASPKRQLGLAEWGMALRRRDILLALAFAPLSGLSAEESPIDLAAIPVQSAAGEILLSDLAGAAPAIVHFWATWCAPCRAELPELEAFAARLDALGLRDRLIVVSVDRFDFSRVADFLRADLGLRLETVQDANGAVGPAFALFGYPSTVLLDAGHRVVARYPGAIAWTDPEMADRLIAHVQGAGTRLNQ